MGFSPSMRPLGVRTDAVLNAMGAMGKVAVQRAGGLIRLIERERVEQRVALRVRVAAVVQRAAGAREGRNVPVRRQAHLAEIQVKIPVLQRGQIVAPRE